MHVQDFLLMGGGGGGGSGHMQSFNTLSIDKDYYYYFNGSRGQEAR